MGMYRFHYFDRLVEVTLPDARIIKKAEPAAVPALEDIYRETIRAIRAPIGAPPLVESLDARDRVLLVVPDKGRHTDLRDVLRGVLDGIAEAGVPKGQITILIALGTHRRMTREEIEEKYSAGILSGYRVVNHAYDDPSALIDLGETADGLPVQFNRLIDEHDFVISVGNISPHPVGGYSGGAKGVLPGIAGKRSTDYFHWEATKYPLFDIFGNADNPVRGEMEAIVSKAGLDFIVNTTENSDRKISGVFAGHFVEAHRAGVDFLKKSPLIAFPVELPDVLVIGLGADRPDFWGGAAGIYAAAAFLKEGGTLVLFAACPEGVAKQHPIVLEYGYGRWQEVRESVDRGEVLDRTGASHVVTVGKIIEQKKMKVFIVSEGITAPDAERLGFVWFPGPREAVDRALEEAGRESRVLIYERI